MNTKWEEEFDKDYPQCDCKNNLPPHFEDSKVNRAWIKHFIRDQIIKTQQEIAEQIISEIPIHPIELIYFEDKLRKKYLK